MWKLLLEILRCFQLTLKRNSIPDHSMFILAPLGSISELPAESCDEIKASEGDDAVSGNHWFMSMIPGEVFQAPCNLPEGTDALFAYQ